MGDPMRWRGDETTAPCGGKEGEGEVRKRRVSLLACPPLPYKRSKEAEDLQVALMQLFSTAHRRSLHGHQGPAPPSPSIEALSDSVLKFLFPAKIENLNMTEAFSPHKFAALVRDVFQFENSLLPHYAPFFCDLLELRRSLGGFCPSNLLCNHLRVYTPPDERSVVLEEISEMILDAADGEGRGGGERERAVTVSRLYCKGYNTDCLRSPAKGLARWRYRLTPKLAMSIGRKTPIRRTTISSSQQQSYSSSSLSSDDEARLSTSFVAGCLGASEAELSAEDAEDPFLLEDIKITFSRDEKKRTQQCHIHKGFQVWRAAWHMGVSMLTSPTPFDDSIDPCLKDSQVLLGTRLPGPVGTLPPPLAYDLTGHLYQDWFPLLLGQPTEKTEAESKQPPSIAPTEATAVPLSHHHQLSGHHPSSSSSVSIFEGSQQSQEGSNHSPPAEPAGQQSPDCFSEMVPESVLETTDGQTGGGMHLSARIERGFIGGEGKSHFSHHHHPPPSQGASTASSGDTELTSTDPYADGQQLPVQTDDSPASLSLSEVRQNSNPDSSAVSVPVSSNPHTSSVPPPRSLPLPKKGILKSSAKERMLPGDTDPDGTAKTRPVFSSAQGRRKRAEFLNQQGITPSDGLGRSRLRGGSVRGRGGGGRGRGRGTRGRGGG
eukprot:Cvel_7628.t1-p1 / transcript=Cvel_7628.t1 / gene=Cvel_7628 / organism=Chromera_velia_CCMP2878 / gene_product=hypothetical protein / transcript_product=hypothetical protein / location=Cvel_scaffold402:88899-91911(+) / protein_length=658 / sequence_SO=supercontig / SO=protein_coding / is_pseudo=false